MKYFPAPEWNSKINELVQALGMEHVQLDRLVVFKSTGSSTKRTIARIHTLPKILQLGLNTRAFYCIELITERFDKLSEEEKVKSLIHELLHIPKTFGGGFRQHDYVCRKNVDIMYNHYQNLKLQR